ncbi:MAG: DUF1080 domain-containing protein [Candidatus Hydrogenedentes bacterium]|nr:DUF1080 domain-containing protein [Candidatus Hydrogenedentota bacterium]
MLSTSSPRALLLAAALLLSPLSAPAADDGFTPLFNGKDLTGWTGDMNLWRVENGEIVGSTKGVKLEKNSFLSTEKSYSDFVLRVKVKLINHNSGIQFRSEQLEDHAVAGYQADVAEQTYFGMLYEERKRGILPYWNEYTDSQRAAIADVVKHGDWNEYVITCQGDRVKMVLNGYTTLDFVDPEGAKAGIIALQLHSGPEMEVRFKDIEIKELGEKVALKEGELLPDFEAREAKLSYLGERFRLPEGFSVEEVATHELTGSLITLTFDHLGRPVVGAQDEGIRVLVDENGDGRYEAQESFSEAVTRVMGLLFLGPGDLLAQGNGPEGPGLYRLTDADQDGQAEQTTLLMASDGGMGEHGPHAIQRGLDGYIYVQYGNHARPAAPLDARSPSRDLREDYLLPRYVDPRGHANDVMAPGGTIVRADPAFTKWEQVAGGFRNAYDFAIDRHGELLTFDSDMEWDLGLPWFRPIRVIHVTPGGDYGWRTGSSKMPAYYIDTLPGVSDVGRGSPVGVCVYEHDAFPPEYRGAFFMGDWSRGRIRVLFPEPSGATIAGRAVDFLVGEPLNVTDLDVAPNGDLYFATGGRGTQGGVYRVRYGAGQEARPAPVTIAAVLDQPMPRSAWGRHAIESAREAMGEAWGAGLLDAAQDPGLEPDLRVRAIEALQVFGPQPEPHVLAQLARDPEPRVKDAAIYLMGCGSFETFREPLINALYDKDASVTRRACEAIVRSGLDEATRVETHEGLISGLYLLLDSEDRHVRYAARLAMMRMHRDLWSDHMLRDDIGRRPRGALEGLAALIATQRAAVHSDAIFAKLDAISQVPLETPALLDFLRVIQLALIRDVTGGDRLEPFRAAMGPRLLGIFPHADARVNRELQVVLAALAPPGAVEALIAYLTPDKPQEEQIHTMYALRAIERGWTEATRQAAVAWFDRGREMTGGASIQGFIDNMWSDLMARLPEAERVAAEERKARSLRAREEETLALLAEMEGESAPESDLVAMSFEEIAEYLEYDPMAYTPRDLEQGKRVFLRAKCANCHVFGSVGQGGGPDLSTVASRFRRRDLLEAIMYPSRVVSDQYEGVEVELDDFTTVSGMLAGENAERLTLITLQGERVDIPKASIELRTKLERSTMPEGLVQTMTLEELVSLVQFLERGGDES